jgi:methanogenic corrinoid protein MtbC1
MTIDPTRPLYPMRVVLRRTGLTPDLLRAWERRYGVVAPGRTSGGQRLYSEADVERLTLLRRATLFGHAISQVAGLENGEIARLLFEPPVADLPGVDTTAPGEATCVVAQCLEAVKWMNGAALDTSLRQAAMTMGPVRFTEHVVAPLVHEIGERWHGGELRIVQEHLATSVVRQVVGEMMSFARPSPDGKTLVAATTSGQLHEIGAMLAAALAASRGWRPIYLGADLAGEEIAEAAERTGADAVALSIVFPTDDGSIAADLTTLAKRIGRDVSLYAGGTAAAAQRPLLDRLGIEYLEQLSDLATRLPEPATAVR